MLHEIQCSGSASVSSLPPSTKWNPAKILQAALVNIPRIIVHISGDIAFLSEAAREVLRNHFGADQILPPSVVHWVRGFPRCGQQHVFCKPGADLVFSCVSWLNPETLEAEAELSQPRELAVLSVEDRCINSLQKRGIGVGLTSREAEIVAWIAFGKSSAEIAIILNRSPRTIHKHCEHAFEKLGASTRSEVVARILSAG